MQEAAEEEQLQQQRVEFFSRADDSGAWQSIGQGTVMWRGTSARRLDGSLEQLPKGTRSFQCAGRW